MSDFVQQQSVECGFDTSDSWVILSPIEQSIKRKIESVGTPLKDWDIQINYGIKTGFNEAFIITTEKRNEILENCSTEEERTKTAELIRPILRGRDIKKYGYDWANLWLINTHNGIKGVKPRIDINEYPSVKAHLDKYWDKISKRADKGDTPYNLRNCAYMDDFSKPKIVYSETNDAKNTKIAFDDKKYLSDKTCFVLIGKDVETTKHAYSILKTNIFSLYMKNLAPLLGEAGISLTKDCVERFPLCPIGENYNFSEEEIKFLTMK